MRNAPAFSEADILTENVAPDRAGLSQEPPRSLLSPKFPNVTTGEICRLFRKNNQATITDEERTTPEKSLPVGRFLDLVEAKACLSLRQSAD